MLDPKKVKEYLPKYTKWFKESDEKLKIKEKFLASSAINPFIIYNSSPRGLMMSSHLSQSLVLDDPDTRIIRTGLEEEFGKYSMVKKLDNDVEVIAVIPRYRHGIDDSSIGYITEYTIVYRDIETEEVNIIDIPKYNRFHLYFGFIYNIDKDYIESLMPGDIIPAGKVLAWPNSYDPETGEYKFGKNMNVAFMSLEGVSEDGIIITESAAKKLGFKIIEHREIEVGSESFLLNLYGNDENYKPFPEIGETINRTSVVAAKRKIDPLFAPGLLSISDVKRFNPIFDDVLYVTKPGSEVIDLKVYRNNRKRKGLPKDTNELLDKYADALLRYYQEVIEVYNRLNRAYRKVNNTDLVVGYEFNNLLLTAMNVVYSEDPKYKLKKTYRNEPLDLYRAEFEVKVDITPTMGYKLTDLYGGKGVIVRVIRDEDAPVDKDGNRADIILDPAATVSRLNIGRLYERYIGAASRKAKMIVTKEVSRAVGRKEVIGSDINKLTDKQIKDIFKNYVLEFVKLFENEQYTVYKEAYDNNDYESMRKTISEIIDKEFYVYLTVENEKRAYEIVLDILDSPFKPTYDKVKYKDGGHEFETEYPVLIAPMYIILLNKIADGLLTTSSAKVNHFGLPIGVSKADKYKLPFRNSPVRAVGETEGRLYGAYGGRRFLAELVDRGASTDTHANMYKNILEAEQPTNMEMAVDRKIVPYGKHKALEILEVLFNSVGMDIDFSQDLRRFVEPTSMQHDEELDIDNVDIVEGEEDHDED
jgi:DNA-directed RNA polymerase beta subunit